MLLNQTILYFFLLTSYLAYARFLRSARPATPRSIRRPEVGSGTDEEADCHGVEVEKVPAAVYFPSMPEYALLGALTMAYLSAYVASELLKTTK